MKKFISLSLLALCIHPSIGWGTSLSCADKVQIAAEGALNAAPGVDPQDPFYVAGNPNLISENADVQIWTVPFDLGVDGGGKFEVGIVTRGEGSGACTLNSGFQYINGKIVPLTL